MSIDSTQLLADMKNAASSVLNNDVATIRGFSERQLQAIALQATYVQAGIINGEITEATRDFFLDGLEEMALNFARTLRGLVTVLVEKVWNAIVGVIWKAIEKVTGLAMPHLG